MKFFFEWLHLRLQVAYNWVIVQFFLSKGPKKPFNRGHPLPSPGCPSPAECSHTQRFSCPSGIPCAT